MDTKVVEVRKNVTVILYLDEKISEYTYSINNVPFIPDEVIVKSIYYDPEEADPEASYIYSDMVSDTIGHFYQNDNNITCPHFSLKKPVSGTYKVKILDGEGDPYSDHVGYLSIVYEFVKYKEVKEGKIY